MAQLKANKFEVEHESKIGDSSIVIINTCGFIENAKEESINTIDFVDAKKDGLVEKYVSGCLSRRYKDQLEEEIPDVDAYFGTKDLPNILGTNADYSTNWLENAYLQLQIIMHILKLLRDVIDLVLFVLFL